MLWSIIRYIAPAVNVFCMISVLKNFVKFTGEHLRQSPLFPNLLKVIQHLSLPVNFTKYFRIDISQNIWRLLLGIKQKMNFQQNKWRAI